MSEPAATKSRLSAAGHWIRRGIPILVLLLTSGAAYFYWQRADHSPEPAAAAPAAGPVPVSVLTIRRETVPVRMRFLGMTEASQAVDIRARVAGHIVERPFTEGELVQAGQKLFQVDPRPFEVALLETKARLASAVATREQASQELRRYRQLVARDAATKDDLEKAQARERVAAADVALQEAQIASAELQLRYASIGSPITGKVGQALKDVGSYIGAANELLATVQQVDPIEVRFSVTEQEILRFRRQVAEGAITAPELTETELEVTLSDGSMHPHRGRIDFLDVQIDLQTGTAVTRGVLPNPEGHLIPGQFVYATVLGVRRVDVVRIPQSAVLQSPVGASVYVVNEESMVEARPVTLGEWSGEDQWVVEGGLQPGERIVTDRLMMVRPGTPVAPNAADLGPAVSEAH